MLASSSTTEATMPTPSIATAPPNALVQAAQPATQARDAAARAWAHLLNWAAEAPAAYRMPLAQLLEMSAHNMECDRARATLRAGAARLDAVTRKEGTR
jgi:hypothetical protein